MSVLSNFWLSLLEVIIIPFNDFFGYNNLLSFILLIFFVAVQLWIFYHLFLKPFFLIFKFFLDFVNNHFLWKEVEFDEKKNS